jgi:hypothetical protein
LVKRCFIQRVFCSRSIILYLISPSHGPRSIILHLIYPSHDTVLFKKTTDYSLRIINIWYYYRIHQSTLDDAGVTILLQHIMKNTTIIRLDFSHCNIGDQGALAVGKLLIVHPTLKELLLCNNKIGKIHRQNFIFLFIYLFHVHRSLYMI